MFRFEQTRSPFSLRKEGPQKRSEIEIARKQHAERDKQLEKAPKLELLPAPDALFRYLQKRGRGHDCTDQLHCNPEEYEPTLMDDLYAARGGGEEQAGVLQEIREVIWAGSWRLHKQHNPTAAKLLTERLKQGVEEKQREIAQTDSDGAKELNEEIVRLQRVTDVLRALQTGEQIEDATRTIEDWYKNAIDRRRHRVPGIRKQAEAELSALRIIRDELYYSRLFPNLAETRNVLLEVKKPSKKN